MANNDKKKSTINKGDKLYLNFYSKGITPNGKEYHKFTHDWTEQNQDGTYVVKQRWYITFWGTYDNSNVDLQSGKFIYVKDILSVGNVVMGKSKTTGATYPCQYITISISLPNDNQRQAQQQSQNQTYNENNLYYGNQSNTPYNGALDDYDDDLGI